MEYVFNIFAIKRRDVVFSQSGLLIVFSVEVSENLATDVLSLGLLVVHDTIGGGQDDLSELSGGEDVVHELLEVLKLEVVAGRDNSALVEAAVEVNNNLSSAGVINDGEVIDVSVLLHALEESDEHFRDRSQNNLNKKRIRLCDTNMIPEKLARSHLL
jgi:nitrogen regulatory protein PII